MHKLERPSPAPSTLSQTRHLSNNWEHPKWSADHKKPIMDALCEMQANRCAYCEGVLEKNTGHIEHFKKRSLFPELTFCWDNLFYSCLSEEHCGKKKDKVIKTQENNLKLIDPCKENPEHFLVFSYDGVIAPRTNLSHEASLRANFTISALNLNEPKLVQQRKNILRQYEWLMQYSTEEIDDYLTTDVIKGLPYITAIYHYFGKRFVSY
ncbi:MAG: retron system putative HNH endonuclease [bacterium]|nr:retron system putative HNH endonuclease [bacterium]